jgi:hypothetical protein
MSFFHFGRKSGQHFVIIFDIGSASIGGAFVNIEVGKIPEIIFTIRRDIPFQEKLNFDRFLSAMITTLEEMFVTMKKSGGDVHIASLLHPGMHHKHDSCTTISPFHFSSRRKDFHGLSKRKSGYFAIQNYLLKTKVARIHQK